MRSGTQWRLPGGEMGTARESEKVGELESGVMG